MYSQTVVSHAYSQSEVKRRVESRVKALMAEDFYLAPPILIRIRSLQGIPSHGYEKNP